ncbi:hypothetical protein K7432_006428 [Basidiobolus ranarum]|uniref:Uncharacterized protein n=1 Tax=Basidiobolus ranarum TaxID=34480 RepID=A0ABR2W221_9FUNG
MSNTVEGAAPLSSSDEEESVGPHGDTDDKIVTHAGKIPDTSRHFNPHANLTMC